MKPIFKNENQVNFDLHFEHLYLLVPGTSLTTNGLGTLLKFEDEHLGQDFIATSFL